jgi:hypothetical protein
MREDLGVAGRGSDQERNCCLLAAFGGNMFKRIAAVIVVRTGRVCLNRFAVPLSGILPG